MVHAPTQHALHLDPVLYATMFVSGNDGHFNLYALPKPARPQFEGKDPGALVYLGHPSGMARRSVLNSANSWFPVPNNTSAPGKHPALPIRSANLLSPYIHTNAHLLIRICNMHTAVYLQVRSSSTAPRISTPYSNNLTEWFTFLPLSPSLPSPSSPIAFFCITNFELLHGICFLQDGWI